MLRIVSFVFLLALLSGGLTEVQAHHRYIVGSWFFNVTPIAVPPEFPEPPPPFISVFNFERGKTLVETDSSIHPGSTFSLLPPDILPVVSASNGYGAWKRVDPHQFRCRFLKILYDESGTQVGLISTTLDLMVHKDGTLEGEGMSDFIVGSDPSAEAFFSGPVVLTGSRLRVKH